MRLWRWLGLVVGLLGGTIAGAQLGSRLAPAPAPAPRVALRVAPRAAPLTLLVMVADAKGHAGRRSLDGNTDTMLLARLMPQEHRIAVLALPRDTRVPIPGHGTFKINAANAYGGPELARATVAAWLGRPVDRYLLLSLKGVRAAVDALGGVTVTVPRAVHYTDHAGGLYIDIHAGRQHMDGARVESYLRFRHDDAGDLGRLRRLEAFLREAALGLHGPAAPWRAWRAWRALGPNVRTDLAPGELLELLHMLRDLEPGQDLSLASLPGREDRSLGAWYWLPDRAAIAPFLARTFGAPR